MAGSIHTGGVAEIIGVITGLYSQLAEYLFDQAEQYVWNIVAAIQVTWEQQGCHLSDSRVGTLAVELDLVC